MTNGTVRKTSAFESQFEYEWQGLGRHTSPLQASWRETPDVTEILWLWLFNSVLYRTGIRSYDHSWTNKFKFLLALLAGNVLLFSGVPHPFLLSSNFSVPDFISIWKTVANLKQLNLISKLRQEIKKRVKLLLLSRTVLWCLVRTMPV